MLTINAGVLAGCGLGGNENANNFGVLHLAMQRVVRWGGKRKGKINSIHSSP